MNNINLEYDIFAMDNKILKEYFSKKDLYLFSNESGNYKSTDLHGNVYDVKLKLPSSVDRDSLIAINYRDIIENIKKKTQLIVAAEYFMRGILPVDTKREIDKIIEYIQYSAHLFATVDVDERLKHLKAEDVEIKINGSHSLSSIVVIFLTTAVGKTAKIFSDSSIIFPINMIIECCTEAKCFQFSVMYKKDLNADFCDSICNKINIMSIFENSDQDSAIDSLMSTWSKTTLYQPLKHILVQESIEKDFIGKLTERLNKLKLIVPNGYKFDNNLKSAKDLFIKSCLKDDIDHIKMDKSFYSGEVSEYFKPLVLMNKFHYDTLKNDKKFGMSIPVVNLQTFRTTKEAISLINSISPFGVSIWCDNSSIWNETALSSDISCAWINCYDYASPAVSVAKKLKQGTKYYGGIYGLITSMIWKSRLNYTLREPATLIAEESSEYSKAVDKLIKLQENWKATTHNQKAAVFIKIANILNDNEYFTKKLIETNKMSEKDAKKCINDTVKYLKEAACLCGKIKNESYAVKKNVICTEIVEPMGLIVVRGPSEIEFGALGAVAVMACGNGVIYSTMHPLMMEICKVFADNGLPIIGIKEDNLSEYYNRLDAVKGLWIMSNSNSSGSGYVVPRGDYRVSVDLCSKLDGILSFKEILEERFCYRKAIWNTYGETFSN